MTAPKMKAIICTKYGSPDFLQLREVERPSPKDSEVLVKVQASTVTKADTMMRQAKPFISRLFLGWTKPKHDIMGTGFAGIIEAIGKDVRHFKVGDEVFGETGVTFGANAEYVTVPADGVIAKKLHNMTYEEAATLCDGPLTSMNFLKNLANIQPGQRILINGASGSLGTAAVQLAKYFGAVVTGVCSDRNVELVKSLGADDVIDYKVTDFTKNGDSYDVIYDTVGKRSYASSKGSLKPGGIYMSPVLGFTLLLQMMWTSKVGNKKAKFSATGLQPPAELRKLLAELTEIIRNGHLKSIIDRTYPLEQTADAHRYVDGGHKRGNVVIAVAGSNR